MELHAGHHVHDVLHRGGRLVRVPLRKICVQEKENFATLLGWSPCQQPRRDAHNRASKGYELYDGDNDAF